MTWFLLGVKGGRQNYFSADAPSASVTSLKSREVGQDCRTELPNGTLLKIYLFRMAN